MRTLNLRLSLPIEGGKLALIALLFTIALTNCKKQISLISNNGDLSAKVNAWLDKNKSGTKVNKNANIELLKQNLDFDAATIEQRDNNNDFLIVPIKEAIKAKKNFDKNATLHLLLVMNKAGKIKSGSIVEFLPADQKRHDAISPNTFHNIFNSQPVEEEGMFKFLSVTERWMYQLVFKNKKLVSSGIIKPNNNNSSKQIASNCTDWYLVTTYYFADGSSDQTSQYVGTTCDGGCDDPAEASLCPDDGSGSGDPTDPMETDDVTFSDDETQYTGEDEDATAGGYVAIHYFYHASIIRDAETDVIESVEMYPVTASPMYAIYIDGYGRNVARSLTLFGQNNIPAMLTETSVALLWDCFVIARYTYTDGTPVWTRQWEKTRSEVR